MGENDEANAQRAELSGFHRRGRDILHAQTRAIDSLIQELDALDPAVDREPFRVPLLMLQAVGVSVHSVLKLTSERDMGIRDSFGIVRAAVETSINAAYIALSGEQMAEKAIRHMRQKRWRDLRRHGRVGDLRITVSRDVDLEVDDVPGLREALEEYTNKRGEEVRNWTPENLEKRVSAISDFHRPAGLSLGIAYFAIYRPASELLHGTYYGVNLFWQGSRNRPARGRDEFDALWVTEHFVTLLTSIFFAASGAINAIAAVHSLAGHSQRQDMLSQELSALIEEMSGGDGGDEHKFSSERA